MLVEVKTSTWHLGFICLTALRDPIHKEPNMIVFDGDKAARVEDISEM